MSTNLPSLFNPSAIPAHIIEYNNSRQRTTLLDVARSINRISLKNSRFSMVIGGQLVATLNDVHLDVIILKASGKASRMYFDTPYDPATEDKARPACWSTDGVKPDTSVTTPCSAHCAGCPKNVKGSALANGSKAKACGYQSRLAVVLANDPELNVYQLDAKGGTLFGPDYPGQNLRNMSSYARCLDELRADTSAMVTRISFDMKSSTPKLLFAPVRWLDPDEIEAVRELADSEEVASIVGPITISAGEADNAQGSVPQPVAYAQPTVQPYAVPTAGAPVSSMAPPAQMAPAAPAQYPPQAMTAQSYAPQQGYAQPQAMPAQGYAPQQSYAPQQGYAPQQAAPVAVPTETTGPAVSALKKGGRKKAAGAQAQAPMQAPMQAPPSPTAPTYAPQPQVAHPLPAAGSYAPASPTAPTYAPQPQAPTHYPQAMPQQAMPQQMAPMQLPPQNLSVPGLDDSSLQHALANVRAAGLASPTG